MGLLTKIVTILNAPNNKMIIKKAYDRLGKFLLFQLVRDKFLQTGTFFYLPVTKTLTHLGPISMNKASSVFLASKTEDEETLSF